MNHEEQELMNKMEILLKNNPLVTRINRVNDHFEMFMKDEKIPITVEIGIDENTSPVKYQVEMEYKIHNDPEDYFTTHVLTDESPQKLVDSMIINYQNMKKEISELKSGFKKYTGIDSDDTVTSLS